jgi:NitT/TauT family transport system substrate-binding protein
MKGKTMMRAFAVAAMLCGALTAATAQEIRLAQQFSMGYLQLNVMQHQRLIEKHAAALGIPNAKVSWFKFNGPTAVNEALISGNIDIGSGGVPGLLTLWARTKGTPQEVRGISALSSQPFLLNTRDPNIKTIKDFKDSDRIAVPAVKSSVQALTLQMAAAKAYGEKEFEKLDPLTVSMTPPDATVALLKGGAQITAAFSVPPFQYQQLEDKSVHTVLNSFDVMGGSHTFTAIWTSPSSAIRIRRSTRPSSPRSRKRPRSSPGTRVRPRRSGSRIPSRSFRSTLRARSSPARRCTGPWCPRTP